jgi:hypothetical protein
MPYQSYDDLLRENRSGHHHVFGSSLVVLVMLAIALIAVSLFRI